jgi:hypothetical protein
MTFITPLIDGSSRWFPLDGIGMDIKAVLIVPSDKVGKGLFTPLDGAISLLLTPLDGISLLIFKALDFSYPLLASLQPSKVPAS